MADAGLHKFVTRKYGVVKEISGGAALQQALRQAKAGPVVLDVFATWCGPCQRMEPELRRLAAEFPEVVFLKMDGDANKALVGALGIRGYPTFRVYRFGKKFMDVVGARVEELRKAIETAVLAWQADVFAPAMAFSQGIEGTINMEELVGPERLSVLRTGKLPVAPAPAPAPGAPSQPRAAASGAAATAPTPGAAAAPAEQGLTFKQAIDRLLASNPGPAALSALQLLAKSVGNVVASPHEIKFRSIRLSNRVFAERVAACAGGVDCMLALGFVRQRGPLAGADGDAAQDYLVLPDASSAALSRLNVARLMLQAKIRAVGGRV